MFSRISGGSIVYIEHNTQYRKAVINQNSTVWLGTCRVELVKYTTHSFFSSTLVLVYIHSHVCVKNTPPMGGCIPPMGVTIYISGDPFWCEIHHWAWVKCKNSINTAKLKHVTLTFRVMSDLSAKLIPFQI